MALAEIDEHGRKGEREQKPFFLDLSLKGRGRRNDRTYGEEIKNERHALPRQQRQPIGHRRQQAGEAEEERRVMPAVKLRSRAKDRLLARELLGRVEGRGRLAVAYIS